MTRLGYGRHAGKSASNRNNGRVFAARTPWCSRWAYAWLLLLLHSWLLACDGPERQIVLGPLPPRMRDASGEDAGVEIPEGTLPCDDDSDCADGVDCTTDVCLAAGYCQSINSG